MTYCIFHPTKPIGQHNTMHLEMLAIQTLFKRYGLGNVLLGIGYLKLSHVKDAIVFGNSSPQLVTLWQNANPHIERWHYFSGDPDFLAMPKHYNGLFMVPWIDKNAFQLASHYGNKIASLPVWLQMFSHAAYKPIGEELLDRRELCYVGYNRKRYDRLFNFCHTNMYESNSYGINRLFRGVREIDWHNYHAKTEARHAIGLMRQHGSSLVIGDPGYEQFTLWSHRILQSFAAGITTFIDRQLAPKGSFAHSALTNAGAIIVGRPGEINFWLNLPMARQSKIEKQYKKLYELRGLERKMMGIFELALTRNRLESLL